MAENFLRSYGLEALLEDERFATNEARVRHASELDAAIEAAIGGRSLQENLEIIEKNKLTAVHVQTIAEIERDPHWQARQLTLDVADDLAVVRMHNVFPRLSGTPGEIRWAGGRMGAHNDDFFSQQFGLSLEEIEALRNRGIV
jgi:formyl-CoA transferase